MVICVLFLGAIFLCHGWILRILAEWLVTDEPFESGMHVLLYADERSTARAAELYHAGLSPGILFIAPKAGRLDELGLVPTATERFKKSMASHHVPESSLLLLPGQRTNDWQAARILGEWLNAHPRVRVAWLTDRFASSTRRRIIDQVLDRETAQRVAVCAVPSLRYDETNWWHRKEGVLDFFNCSVIRAYTLVCGERTRNRPAWNPDEYERMLRGSP